MENLRNRKVRKKVLPILTSRVNGGRPWQPHEYPIINGKPRAQWTAKELADMTDDSSEGHSLYLR